MLLRISHRLFRVPPVALRVALRYLAGAFVLWIIIDVFLVHSRVKWATKEFEGQNPLRHPVRLFVSSLHWNSEKILRDFWNDALVDLVKALGPNNVFISIYGSASWDGTQGLLEELDKTLDTIGVPRKVTLDPTTHADEIANPPKVPGNGWIKTPRDQIELRRIPYLARLRNLSLKPLLDLASNGTTYDYVLFLGDVVFKVQDVVALLNTNNGNYAAACALDFIKPPRYYDTFALRDAEGHDHATYTWPYFRAAKSRSAMKLSKPAPVSSCWNGMVVMPAASFTGAHPIAFRGVDDSLAELHLEGSECCLIHADNPSSKERGVYLNPNVRVGYNGESYEETHPDGSWLTFYAIWTGLWKNRLKRWFTTPLFKEWTVGGLKSKWEAQQPHRKENGLFCLINEMQVLAANGWAHV